MNECIICNNPMYTLECSKCGKLLFNDNISLIIKKRKISAKIFVTNKKILINNIILKEKCFRWWFNMVQIFATALLVLSVFAFCIGISFLKNRNSNHYRMFIMIMLICLKKIVKVMKLGVVFLIDIKKYSVMFGILQK